MAVYCCFAGASFAKSYRGEDTLWCGGDGRGTPVVTLAPIRGGVTFQVLVSHDEDMTK